ncbi:hypothetical protein [Egicoccus sp. AB-alg2]|uniref:hypothetical protein n=1 Tax=Egicoccus sp. AB-alg2 TaxID=3242693 RepID=UPI00359EF4DB
MWKNFFEYAADHDGPVQAHAAAAATGLTVGRLRARARREGWWTPPEVRHVCDHRLAVVSAPRLVRDLAGGITLHRLTALTIDLVQQRHLRLEDLARLLAQQKRFEGRPLVTAVVDRLEASGRVDSIPELRARDRLVEAGIPLDRGQVRVVCLDGVPIHFDLGIAVIRFGIDIRLPRADEGDGPGAVAALPRSPLALIPVGARSAQEHTCRQVRSDTPGFPPQFAPQIPRRGGVRGGGCRRRRGRRCSPRGRSGR